MTRYVLFSQIVVKFSSFLGRIGLYCEKREKKSRFELNQESTVSTVSQQQVYNAVQCEFPRLLITRSVHLKRCL